MTRVLLAMAALGAGASVAAFLVIERSTRPGKQAAMRDVAIYRTDPPRSIP